MKKFAVIGDVHGQALELMKLLRRIEAEGVDAIFLAGDLVDRGPASVECVRIARTWLFTARNGQQTGLRVVLGNHEENHLAAHYKRVLPGRNFVPKVAHPDVHAALTEADYRWLDTLPHWIGFDSEDGQRWAVTHGGLPPGLTCPGWLGQRGGSILCRTGYLDEKTGRPLKPYEWSRRFWADEYDGRWGFIFFGHTSWKNVTFFKHAIGVDCSKHGKIAAVIVSTAEGGSSIQELYEEIPDWTPMLFFPKSEPKARTSQPLPRRAGPPRVVGGTLPRHYKHDDEAERYDDWLTSLGIVDPFANEEHRKP